MKRFRSFGAAIVVFALAAFVLSPPLTTSVLAASTTFSGQATALRGTVLGIPIGPFADTGPVNPSGDTLEATVLEYPIQGLPDSSNGALRAEVLHAAVVAKGNRSSAEASVAGLTLNAAGQSIAADFLAARASATCNGDSATVAGSSEIAGLDLNGQRVTVTGEANQTIPLPGGVGQIVINEQPTGTSASANSGDITVTALHIVLFGGTDLVIASAHADIACGGTPPCSQQDFVTGGGWTTMTPSGSRANFAIAGGIKNGAYWGHLTYIDHGSSAMKVKGTGVSAYVPTGETSRHIEGTADINGVGGTYSADVSDGGEPGHGGTDGFVLVLSTGYRATGPLGGGNIQLHCK